MTDYKARKRRHKRARDKMQRRVRRHLRNTEKRMGKMGCFWETCICASCHRFAKEKEYPCEYVVQPEPTRYGVRKYVTHNGWAANRREPKNWRSYYGTYGDGTRHQVRRFVLELRERWTARGLAALVDARQRGRERQKMQESRKKDELAKLSAKEWRL